MEQLESIRHEVSESAETLEESPSEIITLEPGIEQSVTDHIYGRAEAGKSLSIDQLADLVYQDRETYKSKIEKAAEAVNYPNQRTDFYLQLSKKENELYKQAAERDQQELAELRKRISELEQGGSNGHS